MKSFHNVRFVIKGDSAEQKNIYCANDELFLLKKGQIIEIKFEELNSVADYEIIDSKEEWEMSDNGDDTNWMIYTVQYVPGSNKFFKSHDPFAE